MKILYSLILFLWLTPYMIQADIGQMVYIKMNLNFKDSGFQELYTTVPDYGFNPDSIQDSDYLRRVLLSWNSYQDSATFFSNWTEFAYTRDWEPEEDITLVGLTNPVRFSIHDILKLNVLDYRYQSAAINLIIPSYYSHQDFLNVTPVRKLRAYSYSCDFTIFQIEESPETNKLILDFIGECQKTIDFESQSEIFETIENLIKNKIIMVTMCTC